ncbi:hypothetical protein [Pseudomonas sp. EA_35y_Pfl2_R5]
MPAKPIAAMGRSYRVWACQMATARAIYGPAIPDGHPTGIAV